MEKLLQEETIRATGPVVGPSSDKDGPTGAPGDVARVSVPVRA
jgi:hypothetical protein